MSEKDQNHPLRKLTPGTYKVPAGEERRYHCVIEQKQWDKGELVSKPRIQKFGLKEFKETLADLKRQDYTVVILHDPVAWIAENAERLEKEAGEKKQQEIDKAVNERLAAMGITEGKTLDDIIAEKVAAATKAAQAPGAGAPAGKEEKK